MSKQIKIHREEREHNNGLSTAKKNASNAIYK